MKDRSLSDQLNDKVGGKVSITGWVGARRDHGKLIFVDVLDRRGTTQVIFVPNGGTYDLAQELRPHWVISVKGEVVERPETMKNSKIASGNIELRAQELIVISKAETPPFEIDDTKVVNEETRLKYRYIDLRSQRMQNNLKTRSTVINEMRKWLLEHDFIEVETPNLTKSTPEGARDYIVPSRLQLGRFYALPQSPQQYKQLLMVAGLERYFQIARCFRDEDTRGDRQPEFTQLDIEMSFVEQEEILKLVEELYVCLVKKFFPDKQISEIPFPRITYEKAMSQYGSDKPDIRRDKNNSHELAFCFIVDFPMFEWQKTEKRWDAMHHPFTQPKLASSDRGNILEALKNNPQKLLSFQHDFVCNGYEIGGGSMRTTDPEILIATFQAMGNRMEKVKEKFGHLLEAFRYGVPPHGGIAPGIDRFLMVALNEPSIREVIAFPKTGDGRDLLMNAPSKIDQNQILELGLKIVKRET